MHVSTSHDWVERRRCLWKNDSKRTWIPSFLWQRREPGVPLYTEAKVKGSYVTWKGLLMTANCFAILSRKRNLGCLTRAIHNFFHLEGQCQLAEVENILMILGVLRRILVHSEAYREAQTATWEKAHHRLLGYWNTGNHLHRLGNIYTIGLLSMPIHRRRKQIWSVEAMPCRAKRCWENKK